MENAVRILSTFAEADATDDRSLRAMTPQQRVDIFFAIQQRGYRLVSDERLARVCRVLELKQN